jgi:hypothetical protein
MSCALSVVSVVYSVELYIGRELCVHRVQRAQLNAIVGVDSCERCTPYVRFVNCLCSVHSCKMIVVCTEC